MTRALLLSLLALAALTGCDDDSGYSDDHFETLLPDDQLAPPIVLTTSGTCPGAVTFSISGATPGGNWAMAVSPNLAPGMPIPGGPCAGTFLRVGPPGFLGASGTASAAGTDSVTFTLPASACSWYAQPVDMATCTTGMFAQP